MATLFSKIVTDIDVTRSLSIPTSSLGSIPFEEGHFTDMNVYDDCGRFWVFRCSIQQMGSEDRVLSVNWIEFVRHKNVRVDDKVIFLEETCINDPTTGAKIKIEVKRKIRLYGQDIWADVKPKPWPDEPPIHKHNLRRSLEETRKLTYIHGEDEEEVTKGGMMSPYSIRQQKRSNDQFRIFPMTNHALKLVHHRNRSTLSFASTAANKAPNRDRLRKTDGDLCMKMADVAALVASMPIQ
ncbi:hypothetical protein LWI28_013111 [Acer negundo]|uniref:TF-B3 domain-containing protein n=1 Tax=Acer negundo TaxID=4023 RepID=A0AAD5I9E7_ACENE|nr:hypothetical protein LWI28_013111 [Acer negundo]